MEWDLGQCASGYHLSGFVPREQEDCTLVERYLLCLDSRFKEYYEDQYACSWGGTATNVRQCDSSRGLPRDPKYIQDPYVLYVVNAVFSAGVGIDTAVKQICSLDQVSNQGGLCLRYAATWTALSHSFSISVYRYKNTCM